MYVLGLGTNLGNRQENLARAITLLADCGQVTALSPVYECDAQLPDNAPEHWGSDFYNMALLLDSPLTPELLLTQLKAIEAQLGRVQAAPRWSPRIIDIDILAKDSEQHRVPEIPHPRLLLRDFCILPFSDIWPEWVAPGDASQGKSMAELRILLQSTPSAFNTRRI